MIVPVRDGTLRVLRAARDAGVRRVVLTSSFAAIGYGHDGPGPYDEATWTNLEAPIGAYVKSKTVAERAAWEYAAAAGLELTVINPTGIFGPALGPDFASSLGVITALLEGRLPFLPDQRFGVADVRDVAALHLVAMADDRAAVPSPGRRASAANRGSVRRPGSSAGRHGRSRTRSSTPLGVFSRTSAGEVLVRARRRSGVSADVTVFGTGGYAGLRGPPLRSGAGDAQ